MERVMSRRRPPKPATIFDLHADHHEKTLVDATSYQAKKLGLKYLGFGRYGKMMMPKQNMMGKPAPKNIEGQMTVTHVVKNGLLVPVAVPPPDNKCYPARDSIKCHDAYFNKQAKLIKTEVEQLKGKRKRAWEEAVKVLRNYSEHEHSILNSVLSKNMLSRAHPTIIRKIKVLDDLFKLPITKLGKNFTVYASVGVPVGKGKAFELAGYLNTTVDPKVALGFANGSKEDVDLADLLADDGEEPTSLPSLIQLELKRGQRALDVTSLTGGPGYQPADNDDEFILPRGSRIIIKDGPIHLKHAVVWRAELDQQDDDFEDADGPK
jgi:hypothetical protein